MPVSVAYALLSIIAVYAALGVVTAGWLIAGGLGRLDRNAAHAPLRIKALWIPGFVALWPLMIARAFGVQPAEDRS